MDAVDVVGIATDHCVRATALDAVGNGFATRVLLHLTAGVAEATTEAALEQLRTAGVELEGEVHRPDRRDHGRCDHVGSPDRRSRRHDHGAGRRGPRRG